MDLFNEEIDFMLYESLEADGLIFEKRKRNLEDPELMKQIIDTVGMLPSSSRKIKKKEYIKQFGGGSWPKGLGKGAFILSLNKAGEARIYDIGSPDEAQDWSESGTEGAPKEEPEDAARPFRVNRANLDRALELLAIRVMRGGESVSKISDAARIYRKYFLKKRVAKEPKKDSEVTSESFLFETEEPEATGPDKETMKAAEKAGRGGDAAADAIVKAFTKEVEIPPDEIKKNLEGLESVNNKLGFEGEHKENMKDASYQMRFDGVKFFIAREAKEALYEGKNKTMDTLTEIRVDLNELKKQQLDESFLTMFGAWIKHILDAMFGGFDIPVSVTGNQREVEAFGRAVAGEKKYIDSAKRYGLNHATTYKNKAVLDTATKSFERETGLKWPFK
mgnify:CR=1 FL=1